MSYVPSQAVEPDVVSMPPNCKCCTSQVRPTGIYEIRFLQASRHAVLEARGIYKRIRHNHPEDAPFNLLIDLRFAGFPPIPYTFNQCQRLFRAHPLPHNARTAYLLAQSSPITIVVNDLYEVLRVKTQWAFFYGDE